MVWNIKYGTLQSWQTLDKITARQSAVLRSVQTHGACCACCIPGFICVGFHHCVAVCQFLIDTCSLASALGQLDSTAMYVLTVLESIIFFLTTSTFVILEMKMLNTCHLIIVCNIET